MATEQSLESIFPALRLGHVEGYSKEPEKNEIGDKIACGRKCTSKTLYGSWDNEEDDFIWSEEYPDNIAEAAENEETMQCAILVRKKKSTDPRRSLKIHSIVIQSPLIKEVLSEVFAGYPDCNLELERTEIDAPFGPFVHRWDGFTSALEDEKLDEETRQHLQLLNDAIAPEVTDIINKVKDYKKNDVVDFKYLWAIFEPGCTVFTIEHGHQMAACFETSTYIETQNGKQLLLWCRAINWEKSDFGWESKRLTVKEFKSTIPISSLPVFPLKNHKGHAIIEQNLIQRGKLFESLCGLQYRDYDGQAVQVVQLQHSFEVREKAVRVQERIVIDAEAYDRFNPHDQTFTHPILDDKEKNVESSRFGHAEYTVIPIDFVKKEESKKTLTKYQQLLCVPSVRGYALKTKRWLRLSVSSVKEIELNEGAFSSLVLPENYKKLLRAFMESQLQFKNDFDDFVAGKGKGIVILLSGSPGTGKTLTVESVAEVLKAPLYSLSAGDLGTDSGSVQERLDDALQLAADWNAVLLIDECDVFLEARSSDNLDRNELVSIFLRTIEYYEGIMFLTTNRLDSIDPAFHSRVHLSLEYPGLEQSSRKEIWSGFLGKIGKGDQRHALSEEDIGKLASLDLNGRQIKNILKTSNLLACSEKTMLRFDHVKTVLEVWRYKVQ
ncbi:putative 26S proteasome regulatory subunit-like protein [Colletotrichum sp. SAR 10_66]|nr:putative 26S proteasome regulatory subunit-like protein [Colletotrichum sp. SAR 10_66]